MGRKKNKKKQKKISVKKERYAKFRKEKPATLDITMPDITSEQQKQKQDDEMKLGRFLRFNKKAPPHEIVKRKEKSKR